MRIRLQLIYRQLVTEVNLLRELNHPMIVKYHERIHDAPSKTIHIIMEFCEGGDLMSLIQNCKERHHRIPEDNIWNIFSQLVMALHYCHHEHKRLDDKGNLSHATVLHRDLKPDNVFLDRTHSNIKLGDFGLSKCMNAAEIKMTSTFVGTPYYMSPELIQGSPYDTKSDIWSLGCLVYELCTLHPPFQASSPTELAGKIIKGKVAAIPDLYSRDLNHVVMQMLQSDPGRRPDTKDLKEFPRVAFAIRLRELAEMSARLKAREEQQALRERQFEQQCESHTARLQTWETDLQRRESELQFRMSAISKEGNRLPLEEVSNERPRSADKKVPSGLPAPVKSGRKSSSNSADLRKMATTNSVRRKQSLININVSGPAERVLASSQSSSNDTMPDFSASAPASSDPASLLSNLVLGSPPRYADDDDAPSPFVKRGFAMREGIKIDSFAVRTARNER